MIRLDEIALDVVAAANDAIAMAAAVNDVFHEDVDDLIRRTSRTER